MGQLHRHEGARERLSSAGWLEPDKIYRTLGGRLAQQVARVVTYDTEYGFGLLEKVFTSPTSFESSSSNRHCTPQRTSEEQTEALTPFVASADARDENKNFGAGVAWFDKGHWRTRSTPSGRYLATIDAELFAISSAAREADLYLRKQEARQVDIWRNAMEVTASRRYCGSDKADAKQRVYFKAGTSTRR
jgi:hypothetical protein